MRSPFDSTPPPREGSWSDEVKRIRIENARQWLSEHPAVPWTVAQLLSAIDEFGEERAAAAAIEAGWSAIEAARNAESSPLRWRKSAVD